MIQKEDLLSLQSFNSEEEYRESSSLNYSLLKELVKGPKALIQPKVLKDSGALKVGSFVDKYFTDFKNVYNIYSVDKRRIELSASWEQVYKYFENANNWEPTTDEIIASCRTLLLFEKMGDAVIKDRIPEGLLAKLELTRDNLDKILLSEEEHLQALYSIQNVESDPEAMSLITEAEGEIILHQFKLEFPIILDSGVTRLFKVMLDYVKINFNTMEIYGIDLKTGERYPQKFYDQFVEYRYDIQAILYYWGLLALMKAIRDRFDVELTIPSSSNFKFLYSPKMQNKAPIIISMDDEWIRLNGGEYLEHKSIRYPGCWKLMNDADWYLTNQEFSNHKIVAQKRCHTISQLSNYII